VSHLADVLAGGVQSGVYKWPTADVAELRGAVEEAGWRFVRLDTSTVLDKTGFLDRAAEAFGFPDYFGRNWDAFADSLGDIDDNPGTVVVWDGWREFASRDEASFDVALEVLRERAVSSDDGRLVVLMRGDGPWDELT
jgi:RNAse (barnase) inhibitor barstar